jgi:hypothetical protein
MSTVQYLPSWFPGCYYAGFARTHKYAIEAMMNYPFEEVQRQMVRSHFPALRLLVDLNNQDEGNARPSFLSTQLEALNRDGKNYPNTAEDIKGAAGVMFFGGADTVRAFRVSFLTLVLSFGAVRPGRLFLYSSLRWFFTRNASGALRRRSTPSSDPNESLTLRIESLCIM